MASKLRASTRRILEPAMAELGFDARYPHFQRKRNDRLELVSLVHDKWSGGFFLEFATHAAGDLQTAWGETVPEQQINVAYTNPATRGRLLATTRHSEERRNYFRYDANSGDRATLDALVNELVCVLPQLIGWFESGAVGPNLSLFSAPVGRASKSIPGHGD